jgi:hypothetical protein
VLLYRKEENVNPIETLNEEDATGEPQSDDDNQHF